MDFAGDFTYVPAAEDADNDCEEVEVVLDEGTLPPVLPLLLLKQSLLSHFYNLHACTVSFHVNTPLL